VGAGRTYRLAILIPNVWGIRNIIHSGVLRSLNEAGVEVHLVMRHVPQYSHEMDGDYHDACEIHPILIPQRVKRTPGKAFLDGVIYSAFMQHNQIRSYPIYSRWFRRSETPRLRLRSNLIRSLGKTTQMPSIYYMMHRWSESLYRRSVDLMPIRQHLRQISPDLLWSTAYITPDEHAYVMAAQDLGIPVLASILSFDNLTSRTSYLQRFHHYTVWSEWMKQQLVLFYTHVSPEQVTVTGTPQFDFHRRAEFCLTRQETLSILGLEPNDRYFVYGASTRQLAPDEPLLVRWLAQRIAETKQLKNYKVVVRLHPLDDWSRWNLETDGLDCLILSGAWLTKPSADGWAFITREEQVRLVSLLTHAEACINIASTIGLDAAVLDRPVIGIDFRDEPQAPAELLYSEYYTEHYLPLVESGAIRIASNWGRLIDIMIEAVLFPDKYRANRQQAVQRICGTVDGRASTRVVATVLDLLAKSKEL